MLRGRNFIVTLFLIALHTIHWALCCVTLSHATNIPNIVCMTFSISKDSSNTTNIAKYFIHYTWFSNLYQTVFEDNLSSCQNKRMNQSCAVKRKIIKISRRFSELWLGILWPWKFCLFFVRNHTNCVNTRIKLFLV